MGCVLGFAVTIGILAGTGQIPRVYVDRVLSQVPVQSVSWAALRPAGQPPREDWPPEVGDEYPDLHLTNQFGEQVQLRDYAGKVILLELAAIPCKGCQAFSGGHEFGDFGGFGCQPGLKSIDAYARRFADVELGDDEDVVFVQLLLYGRKAGSPTAEEVGGWASHFKMNSSPNLVVLRGDTSLISPDIHRRIPGFHLIDRDFVLRYESSGHRSSHDLYEDLLPALGRMANDGR